MIARRCDADWNCVRPRRRVEATSLAAAAARASTGADAAGDATRENRRQHREQKHLAAPAKCQGKQKQPAGQRQSVPQVTTATGSFGRAMFFSAKPGHIRRCEIRALEAGCCRASCGDLYEDVALSTAAERLSGGVEGAGRVRGQFAALKGERTSDGHSRILSASARAANLQGVARGLATRDALGCRAGDADGEIESSSRQRYGNRRGNGRRVDREHSGCGAANARLKDDRNSAVGPRSQAAGAGVLRDAKRRGRGNRNRFDRVVGSICDGHRLRCAGLSHPDDGKCNLGRID